MNQDEAKQIYQDAVVHWKAGRFDEAVALLDTLDAAFPNRADVLFARARCHVARGDTAAARADATRLSESLGDSRGAEILKQLGPPPSRRAPKRSLLIAAGAGVLSLALAWLFLGGGGEANRKFTVPADAAVGVLYQRPAGATDTPWELLGEARGSYSIPYATDLRLVIPDTYTAEEVEGAFQAIQEFPPDTFQSIDASGAPVGDYALVRLARMSELLELSLRNAGISDAGVQDLFTLHALVTLDVRDNPGITDAGLQWLLASSDLESVHLEGTSITGEGLVHARSSKALKRLWLPESTTDEGLRHVGSMEGLEALYFPRAKVTDAGIGHLRTLEGLRVLDASVTPLTNSAAGYIGRLTALRELRLAHTRIGTEGVSRLRKLQHLEVLDLTGAPVGDDGGERLALLRGLQSLTLAACCGRPGLSPIGLEPLSVLAGLRALDLTRNPLGSAAVPILSGFTLQRLDVSGTRMTAADVAALRASETLGDVVFDDVAGTTSAAPRLGWAVRENDGWSPVLDVASSDGALRLRIEAGWNPESEPIPDDARERVRRIEAGTGLLLEDGVIDALAALAATTDVDVSDAVNPLAAGPLLDGMPGVERIALRGAEGTDEEWAAALPERRLVELDVTDANFGAAQVEQLAARGGVDRLLARATALDDGAVDALAGLPALGELDLRETGLTEGGAAQLAQRLPDTALTTSFGAVDVVTLPEGPSLGVLWSRPASGGRWSRVGDAVGAMRVRAGDVLRLDGTDAFVTEAEAIAPVLAERLVALNLAGTALSDATAGRLGAYTNLQTLNVARTNLGDGGLNSLAPLTELVSLNLSGTQVTDDGMAALAAFDALRELDVSDTALTDGGLGAINDFTQLRAVYAEGTTVTAAAVENARAQMPAAFFSFTAAPVALEEGAAPPARILTIPDGPSPGRLSMRPWDGGDDAPWIDVGPLCCETPIPEGMVLRLDVERESFEAIPALAELPADTFHTVRVAPNNVITAELMQSLSRFTGTTQLVLDFCRIEPGALDALQGMHGLRALSLYRAEVDSESLARLRNAPWIASLTLASTGLDDEGLGHVATMEGLTELDVHGNDGLSDAGLARTALAERVTSLNASRTQAGQETFAALRRNDALAEADVFGTRMPADEVSAWAATEGLDGVNASKARFNDYEVELLEDPIRSLANSAEGITSEGLSDIADVDTLDTIDTESLRPIQGIALSAMADSDTGITSEGIAEVAGRESFHDIPTETLPDLQQLALSAMAESDTGITTEGVVEVAGADSFDDISPEGLESLQSMALSAMADSDTGVTSQGMAEVSGVGLFAEIPVDTLPNLQTIALSAMADSDTGITPYSLAQVAGAETFEALDGAVQEDFQRRALSAMANSDTGVTTERVARLVGADNLEALDDVTLTTVRQVALSAMESSDTGITVQGIAELGNAEDYEEMPPPTMDTMQQLTLSAMAESNTGVTSERLATAGGRERFETVQEDRLDQLQRYALSAMADSDTGITVQGMAEVGGVETFEALDETRLASLQVKALSAMADSTTGITRDGIATIAGVDDFARLTDEQILQIQSRTVTALAESRDGIRPETLREFVGDAALRTLYFAGTKVRDEDIRFVTNLSELRTVDLTACTDITDATLEYLSAAPVLDTLIVAYTDITDEGLRFIGRMRSLRHLDLAGTAITDGGMAPLRGLSGLEVLNVSDTAIEGSGLRHLTEIESLSSLDLSKTRFWDGGALHLSRLTTLEELDLGVTDVTDAGLELLRVLSGLRVLELYDCPRITDAGMAHLAPMQQLQRLNLTTTFISEEAGAHFEQLSALRELYLNQQMVSQDAAYRLGQAMPDCLIRLASIAPQPRKESPGSAGLSGRRLLLEQARDPFDYRTIPTRELVARFALLIGILVTFFSGFVVPFTPYIQRNELVGRTLYGVRTGSLVALRATGLGAFFTQYFIRRVLVAFWWVWLILLLIVGIAVFTQVLGFGFDSIVDLVSPGE